MGGGNYSPLEAELARMVLKYRARIGQIAAEKAEMFNSLYSVYSLLNSVKCADGLREKHKKVLAGNSKALFTKAVKLDKELKEYGNEED
jgi:hypothetical protein